MSVRKGIDATRAMLRARVGGAAQILAPRIRGEERAVGVTAFTCCRYEDD